ncbi:DMT family transporter [Candidatus Roizmanbacteria bacterium]|nr:DMT family transporter [Candidatus Roizmanbacteria bacterium]
MWFWFAVLTGVFSAVSVILNKRALYNVSAVLVSWTLFVLPLPFLFIIVLRKGIPQINTMFIIGVIVSSVIYAVTKTISLHSIKNNFLSKIFPLTAFGTLFSYIFALIFLGEKINPIPLFGLFMIIIGSYILNVDSAKENILLPLKLLVTHKESFMFILAMGFTSITGIFDKLGITNTTPNNAFFVLFIEDIILSVLLSIFLLKQEKNWFHDLRKHFWLLLVGSIIYTGVALFFLEGIITGKVALVGGIKKLEILFVLTLSYLFFKDKPSNQTWIGTIVMLIGVVLIKLG